MIVADAMKATHALVAAVPLLGEHPNEKDYRDALELVEYLLMNEPGSPLLDIVCARIRRYEANRPEIVALRRDGICPSGHCRFKNPYGSIQTDYFGFSG